LANSQNSCPFSNFSFFQKYFFNKRHELSLHAYYKHPKKTFLKTATFGNQSSALTFLLHFLLLLIIVIKSRKTPQKTVTTATLETEK
jgi:hypothetical protein